MKVQNNIYKIYKKGNGYVLSILNNSKRLIKVGNIISRDFDNWVEEYLIGVIDNSNRIFNTSLPYKTNTVELYYNGIKQGKIIDFNENGETEIQLEFTPLNTENYLDKLIVRYKK
jgi:hypothetical protein